MSGIHSIRSGQVVVVVVVMAMVVVVCSRSSVVWDMSLPVPLECQWSSNGMGNVVGIE